MERESEMLLGSLRRPARCQNLAAQVRPVAKPSRSNGRIQLEALIMSASKVRLLGFDSVQCRGTRGP